MRARDASAAVPGGGEGVSAKDFAGAKAAIAPVAACPVKSELSYGAHVMRGELAVREADWQTARAMLIDVDIHPEASLSAVAAAIRLRADQGLGDSKAFTADRAALLAANNIRLAAMGRRIETFRAGAATVTAYEASVAQGAFARVLEFMITPDDPAAFP